MAYSNQSPEIISAKSGLSERIQSYLRIYGDTSAKNDYTIQDGHLALATIQTAKGYDSPIVFMGGKPRI